MSTIIVSRHPSAINWIESRGFSGHIVEQFVPEMVQAEDVVIGILPIPLIASIIDAGAEFILLSLPSIAFGQRGQELTVEEMETAGAQLHRISSIVMEKL